VKKTGRFICPPSKYIETICTGHTNTQDNNKLLVLHFWYICFYFRQSYDVNIELNIPGTNSKSTNNLDLKNPFFRYTGQAPQPPPNNNTTSPSDNYWNSLATGLLIHCNTQ